jgi:hypothetical protein
MYKNIYQFANMDRIKFCTVFFKRIVLLKRCVQNNHSGPKNGNAEYTVECLEHLLTPHNSI